MRIAVILPERYRGGTLRGAKNVARMLRLGAQSAGDDLTVSFGYIDDPNIYSSDDFNDLRELGIACRPFRLELAAASGLNPYLIEWFHQFPENPTPNYVLFNDGITNFEECDFWIVVSDRVSSPIPPHRRYAVVTYDYIQRYVPEIFGTSPETDQYWILVEMYARFARSAAFVICTTEQTKSDCLAVAGATPDRVRVFPMEFDPLDLPTGGSREDAAPYALWTTNTTEHKNHLNVIKGLERFFLENPASELQVRISGAYTDLFSGRFKGKPHFDNQYIALVRRTLEESSTLRKRVKILGNVSDTEYTAQLSAAAFCLHGAKYDNGTFAVLEAAWHAVPCLSSDYPAMREMSRRFSVPLTYFDPFQPDTLAAGIEHLMENRSDLVAALPSRDHLRRFSYENVAAEYWRCFKQAYAEA
jgi:glycosyltransferase involved in cell wall biosynthesis